jgi:hypothetical protein
VPELLMAAGYISLGIVTFALAVKYFAVLPGDDRDWNHIFRPIGWRSTTKSVAEVKSAVAAKSEGTTAWPASL